MNESPISGVQADADVQLASESKGVPGAADVRCIAGAARAGGLLVELVTLWLTGYSSPARFADRLAAQPGPRLGVQAQVLRASLDSLLVYLPVALMRRTPPSPPPFGFVSADHYYWFLVIFGPAVLLCEMLIATAFIHVTLRLFGRRSDFGGVANLVGMSALVVGTVLIPWDWAWFALGHADQYFLGLTHLVLSLWATVLIVVGLRRNMGVPVPLGLALSIGAVAVSLPLAIVFMRSPF